MDIKKIMYTAVGCLALAAGAVGAVLPLIPTVPFLLLAALCFSRSSERLNHWFTNTKLYKNNLETYIQGHGMTLSAKLRILATITMLMGFGFFLMKRTPAGQLLLICIWAAHVLYFAFGIKTLKENVQTEANL